MNGLRNGLLVLSLLLAMASLGAAQPVAEVVPPVQPVAEIVPTVQPVAEIVPPVQPVVEIVPAAQPDAVVPGAAAVAGSGAVENAGSGGAVIAAPAAEVIVVSRLEPTVAAVLSPDERQLELRKSDFLKFAEVKLRDMNRNHILSRERMRIEKRADGSYKASYHQIDDASMSYQVSRSPTKSTQYVAVLSYKERVYNAACGTPAECRQGNFTPVEVIPNRHIFVYTNGVWQ